MTFYNLTEECAEDIFERFIQYIIRDKVNKKLSLEDGVTWTSSSPELEADLWKDVFCLIVVLPLVPPAWRRRILALLFIWLRLAVDQ